MEQLVNFIIRPPRAEYDPKNDLLDQEFMLKGKWYQRKDVEIKNGAGLDLQCSHYMPIVSPEGKPLPCVIYCHGNSGCRADGSEAAIVLLPSNITVFTLDFAGSGLSGGEHVTLGWNEKEDLTAVVNYLRADGNVSLIGLWGRSMGAVTSLMYGAEDPSIAAMVLDSPFSDLVDLMMELVDTYKVPLPKFTVKFAIQYMRRAIQKKAKFDIMDLNTIKVAKSCFVPVLLGHANDDDFIHPHHSDHIFEAYAGDKNIIKFEGDHNSPRPQFYFDSINIFFHNLLQPPVDEFGGSLLDNVNDYFGKGGWRSVHDVGYVNESPSAYKEPSANSTADAINQVRSRRPMSRMEVPSDISSKNEHHEYKDEKCNYDLCSSSSKMISFELSNGNPYGPHVPTTLDDDQYVEYQLDDLEGFPSSAEEEERMFMAAILESLKELEMRSPQAEQPSSTTGTVSIEPSEKDNSNASSPELSRPPETESSSSVNHSMHSKAKTVSKSADVCAPLKLESNSNLVTESHNLASEPSPAPSQSSRGAPGDASSVTESSCTTGSAHSDSSSSVQSSSDTDVSANTKATVTVVKNPSNHIMDGLIRRWDFNFFRNSQNR